MSNKSEISEIIDQSFIEQQKAEMKRENQILSFTMDKNGNCKVYKLKGDEFEKDCIFIGNKEELEKDLAFMLYNKKMPKETT